MPPRQRRNPKACGVPEGLQQKYDRIVDSLFMLLDGFDSKSRPIEVAVDEAVREPWEALIEENEDRIEKEDLSPRVAESFAKVEEYSLRLALWHHVMHAVASSVDRSGQWTPDSSFSDEGSVIIPRELSADSMHWGVEMAKWFQREAERIFDWMSYFEGNIDSTGVEGLEPCM